ncbi:MAG: hypothetical protein JO020_28135 [Chloroflexi bacterium]|nr:hypothetical protein [Chloroflexota bacterium]MBV9898043.1 hypothetical protein [Chloroflexota bacterium]
MSKFLVRFNATLNVLLVGLAIVAFATGWIANRLSLSEYPPHLYTSIALFVVAGVHLLAHRRAFTNQVRHVFKVSRTTVRLLDRTAMAIVTKSNVHGIEQ